MTIHNGLPNERFGSLKDPTGVGLNEQRHSYNLDLLNPTQMLLLSQPLKGRLEITGCMRSTFALTSWVVRLSLEVLPQGPMVKLTHVWRSFPSSIRPLQRMWTVGVLYFKHPELGSSKWELSGYVFFSFSLKRPLGQWLGSLNHGSHLYILKARLSKHSQVECTPYNSYECNFNL